MLNFGFNFAHFTSYISFPPSFPDDPTNPSTLNTFYTGKSSGALGEESIGDTDFEKVFKARHWEFDGSSNVPVQGVYPTGTSMVVLYMDHPEAYSAFEVIASAGHRNNDGWYGGPASDTTFKVLFNVVGSQLSITLTVPDITLIRKLWMELTLLSGINYDVVLYGEDADGNVYSASGNRDMEPPITEMVFGSLDTNTNYYIGKSWGMAITADGKTETFHAINGNLENNDGAYIISNRGTIGTISTTDLPAFLGESVDGVTGDDINVLGYSIGTGIYAGQVIPPHADNPDVDALNQLPLQYQPRAKYPVDLVQSPCLAFDGVADYARFRTPYIFTGDFSFSYYFEADYATPSDIEKVFSNPDYLARLTNGGWQIKVQGNYTSLNVSKQSGFATLSRSGSVFTFSVTNASGTDQVSVDSGHTLDFEIKDIGSSATYNPYAGKLYGLRDNIAGIDIPLTEESGSVCYSKQVDADDKPLAIIDINTTDLTAIRAGRQDVYHPHATDGYYDNGDGVFYPYPKAGTTFVEPSFLNNGIFKFKLPPAKGLIGPDLLANLAGDGPYLFNAGVPNEFTQAILVSDGVVNENKLYYMCDNFFTYTAQLTSSQDIDVKDSQDCWTVTGFEDDAGNIMVDPNDVELVLVEEV